MAQKLSHAFIAMMLKKYTPAGWRVLERDSGDGWRDPVDYGTGTIGCAHMDEKIISIRPILDAYSLLIFLHEVAHAKFHKDTFNANEEWEAERWAQQIFQKHNLVVTRKMRSDARWRVRYNIGLDDANGVEVCPKVRKWANYDAENGHS
jgi:hypothetical protein